MTTNDTNTTLSATQLRHVMDAVDTFNKVITTSHEIIVEFPDASDGYPVAELSVYFDDNRAHYLGMLDLLECDTTFAHLTDLAKNWLFRYAQLHD